MVISIISYIVFNYGLANILSYEAQGKFTLYHNLTFILLNNFATALLLIDIYFYVKYQLLLTEDKRDWLETFFTEVFSYFTLSILAIASCGGLYDLYHNNYAKSIWLHISKNIPIYIAGCAFLLKAAYSSNKS